MRVLTVAFCVSMLLPALAEAQVGTSITDPNAAPQGRIEQPVGDTQTNAESAYRTAQARCRGVSPARQHQSCVADAMRELDRQPRARQPSVEVRPLPAASAASAP
jgi:hypothetical protein